MSIAFHSTGGLFPRLGRIGALILSADTYQAAIDARTDDIFDEYDGEDRPQTALTLAQSTQLRPLAVAGLEAFRQLAIATIIKMAGDSNPPAGNSLFAAVSEVIKQMKSDAESVRKCTPGYTATAFSGNVGTGGIVVTTVRGDGLNQENIRAETATVQCISDGYTGGTTSGQESFGYYGAAQTSGPFDYDFPGPSGATLGFNAIDPDSDGDVGTQLTNGGFEDFTVSNTPDDWTITVGSAGTEILSDSSVYYTGTKSLKIVGAATLTALTQGVSLQPLTAYAVNFWIRTSGVPAAGVLTVDLYSATSAAVLTDDAGASNALATSLPGVSGATWTRVSTVFRTPKNPPSDTVFRIRLSTALSVGTNLNIDQLCIAPVLVPYVGGPGIAVFAGATPFVVGDGWNLLITNDQGGSTYGATFQTLFDRLFDMRGMRLVLPSSTSPTINDGLITT